MLCAEFIVPMLMAGATKGSVLDDTSWVGELAAGATPERAAALRLEVIADIEALVAERRLLS